MTSTIPSNRLEQHHQQLSNNHINGNKRSAAKHKYEPVSIESSSALENNHSCETLHHHELESKSPSSSPSDWLSYWWILLGCLNNLGYVIMLASAKSLSEGGTALVFLVNVVPGLLVKLSAPYWFDRVEYRVRLRIASISMALAFGLVGMGAAASNDDDSRSNSLRWQLLGVALVSLQCGLGEASLLALAGRNDMVRHFSTGTGVAGPAGFAWNIVLGRFFGWSLRPIVWAALVWAGVYVWVFERKIAPPSNDGQDQRQEDPSDATCCLVVDSAVQLEDEEDKIISTTTHAQTSTRIATEEMPLKLAGEPVNNNNNEEEEEDGALIIKEAAANGDPASNAAGITGQNDSSLTTGTTAMNEAITDGIFRMTNPVVPISEMSARTRLRKVISLWPYIIPLFSVYAAEYICQAGAWTSIGFPVSDPMARNRAYQVSNTCYQLGVFVSRSSGNWFTVDMKWLWLMPAIQVLNLGIFTWMASHAPDSSSSTDYYDWYYNEFTVYTLATFTGLLGGAVYVHGYQRICKDVSPQDHREFALSSVSVAEGLGIAVADVVSLWWQACLYKANNLPSAVVSCPL